MKYNETEKAFTLLEVVVSLGLLIMVFGSVVSLAILTREAEQTSKNNLIAAYLAKEGQSLVRYQRDKNYLDRVSPFYELTSAEVNGTVYYFLIDTSGLILSSAISDVTSTDLEALYINNGVYSHSRPIHEPTISIFKRLVTTTYHTASGLLPAYIDVKVEVFWKSDTKQNTYTLNSQLTDWH